MKTLIIIAALAIAAPAMAGDLVARQGEDTIRLIDAPCSSEVVLGKVPPQFHSQFMQATAIVQGHTFAACWRKAGGAAHLIYEDGDQGIVPLSDLKPELTA